MTLRRPASRQARLALCLVVTLGSGTIVLAQPQDPGRPYWSDNWMALFVSLHSIRC